MAALAISASAEDQKNKTNTTKQSSTASQQNADANQHAVDNTGRNERDRDANNKTSGDQSNSPADIKITAAIRRAVVADHSRTMTATNVKIITANGVVTLRGPVNTAAEKTRIGELAAKNAGGAKVNNQLEVKKSH